jgi:cation transport ATPase
MQVVAQVLPGEKQERVATLQEQGHIVCFVGDGVNDSPALVQADVGIAIGAGTDIAIEVSGNVLRVAVMKSVCVVAACCCESVTGATLLQAADVVLMRDDLTGIATALAVASSTYNRIR